MKPELKLALCPFCGGKAELGGGGDIREPLFWPLCKNCGATTGDNYEDEEEAIKAWNKRTNLI